MFKDPFALVHGDGSTGHVMVVLPVADLEGTTRLWRGKGMKRETSLTHLKRFETIWTNVEVRFGESHIFLGSLMK